MSINDLIHSFADNTDPELWNRTFGSFKKLIGSPDQEPQEIEFVNVEGKWIPQKMAATWAKRIADVKTIFAFKPYRIPKSKKQLLATLDSLDQLLDQAAKAKTQESSIPSSSRRC